MTSLPPLEIRRMEALPYYLRDLPRM